MSYRVKTVCRLTGIHRSTLLAWERRYAVVEPTRADNGYRVYSEEDVERLRRLKALTDSGHAVSEALRLLGGEAPDDARQLLFERLMAFDTFGAEAIVQDLDARSPTELVSELWMPLMDQVGMAWESGETSVAQEHFASGFARRRLSMLLERTARREGPLAAFFTPSGERHDLGLMGAAIRLAELGWQTTWLGAELPVTELNAYCLQQSPTMVCVSLIRKRPASERNRLLVALREVIPASIHLAVGGRGAAGEEVPGVNLTLGFADLLSLIRSW